MPTGYTTVSSSLLKANGALVANATISFQPVDNNQRPLSVLVDATLGITTGPISATVTAGVFSVNLPDTSLTTPLNAGYSVTLTDNVSGNAIPLYGFGCFQPTGASINFDTVAPNLAAQVTVQSGPPAVFTGAYSSGTTYLINQAVSYLGSSYVSLVSANTGNTPSTSPTQSAQGSTGPAGSLALSQLTALLQRLALAIGQNLFNSATTSPGVISPTTGVYAATSGYVCSDYIPCPAGGTITCNEAIINGSAGYAFYDQGFNFLSGSGAGVTANTPISVPSTAAFFRFTFGYSTTPSTCMVVWGSTMPSSFQAYGTYPSNIVDAHIAAAVVPLAAITGLVERLPLGANMFNIATMAVNYIVVASTGVLTSYSGYNSTDYIPVPPGGQVTCSEAIVSGSAGYAFYDQNFSYISGSGAGVAAATPITVPSGAVFFRFTFYTGDTPATAMVVWGSTIPAAFVPFAAANAQTLHSCYGGTLSAFSDSIFAQYTNLPVTLLAQLCGMSLGVVDCYPGRTTANCLQNFPSGVSVGPPGQTGQVGFTITSGTTLAAALASTTICLIELGANDSTSSGWGTYADSSSVSSWCGHVRLVIETLLAAKRTLRIIWVMPYNFPPASGYYGGSPQSPTTGIPAQTALAQAVCADYGVPVISLLPIGITPPIGSSPGNAVDASSNPLYLQGASQVHWTTLGITQLGVPYMVQQLNHFGPA